MKPGYATTEFWVALLGNVLAILTLFHVGLPANMPDLVQAFAVLAAGIGNGLYAHSRGMVKAANVPATATQPAPVTVPATVPTPPVSAT